MTSTAGVAVELAAVEKRYGDAVVLAGIDLVVAAGELLAIVGQSGQGKSVLLRLLMGLEPADRGWITVGGMDVARYRQLGRAEKPFSMAIVFQSAALLGSLTVAENVALRLREDGASPAVIARTIDRVLDLVDLRGAEHKRPTELSGGMRKRAAIARALALDPDLLLYDEPTADLDPILTEQLAGVIRRIRAERGATQIVVTHHLPLACNLADRIAVLHAGRLVECGPPATVLASTHPFTRAFVRAATFTHDSREVPC
ncbi:MAG: ABC transporter ATP-binding protein [Candidatus Binatia bacterium]